MRHSPFLPRFVKFGVLDMMCYKVPKFIEIEGKMSVFELGNERLKIHSLSAIFFAKKMAERSRKASLHCAVRHNVTQKTKFFLHIFTKFQKPCL